ncbi:radical SAM domain protein [Treponema primitia ZAS-2]|uniref:Radical SAM domain protein n=1 Tax=Treponema primitia (strain ATCC BAA-887 / DSM 12427 / ZAS-2) TaxID=545694 RepID=F5YH39_TREPZ|nr:spiro-SPASM protein [Treponema primitia]AEF84981.1 radical SAM domain protein [Treponema primitia ZAS-2]
MNALTVLYGARLSAEAFEPVFAGKSALSLAVGRAKKFPGTGKVLFLGAVGDGLAAGVEPAETLLRPDWTLRSLLEELSIRSAGFDLIYFAWADCPLLDPALAGALAERHLRYGAEYSYADGWPYGLAPELLSPGTAGILAKLVADDDGPVERDALFSVIQKDINAFDIETEISPVDLRYHRLSLAADSRRNLLLLSRLMEAGLQGASDAERVIASRPELLRTLPAFYGIQVSGPCPQACSICPYPRFGGAGNAVTDRKDFLEPDSFAKLLDKIAAFSGDAVIDISLWGELSLHPQREKLIRMVLAKPELSCVIESSGLGWKKSGLEALAEAASAAAPRKNRMEPLSWIVSLDAADSNRYREIRGPGYAEATECAKTLSALFPGNSYVQAVRIKGAEDDTEQFYRSWKESGAGVIIQKYDDFCGFLPKLQASDLSPVQRRPCWHLMRDMAVLIDGRVPLCREVLGGGLELDLGNAFTEDLETIWDRGAGFYREQASPAGTAPALGEYRQPCMGCDEYYTYNF